MKSGKPVSFFVNIPGDNMDFSYQECVVTTIPNDQAGEENLQGVSQDLPNFNDIEVGIKEALHNETLTGKSQVQKGKNKRVSDKKLASKRTAKKK